MSTRDSNRAVIDERAAKVRADKVIEQALKQIANLRCEYLQKKEEKWTREWAAYELARSRGIQLCYPDALKNFERMVWDSNVEHTCDDTCQQYSTPGGLRLHRFYTNKSIEAKNNIFVCLKTGSIHVCELKCPREYSITGRSQKKLVSVCAISGRVKNPVLSTVRFGDNGICSTQGMADAEHQEENEQRDVEIEPSEEPVEEEEEKEAEEISEVEEENSVEEEEEEIVADVELEVEYASVANKTKRVRLTKSSIMNFAFQEAERHIAAQEAEKETEKTEVSETPAKQSFQFGNVSKKEKFKMKELKVSINNDLKRKQAEEPVFEFSKTRAVTVHQTPEQKLERYLKKGTLHGAENFLDLLVSYRTKNLLALYRCEVVGKEVARTLAELLSMFELPVDIAAGIQYRLLRKAIKMEFYYPPTVLNMRLYSKYIHLHWQAAARTIYTEDSMKTKRPRLQKYHLFCIGMIYCMANGGLMLEERLEPRQPELLTPTQRQFVSVFRLNVQEIPSFRELESVLINKEFLHELHKCVPNFPVLKLGVEQNAQQALRSYIDARRAIILDQFYTAIEAEPNKFGHHFDLYLAAAKPLKPTEE